MKYTGNEQICFFHSSISVFFWPSSRFFQLNYKHLHLIPKSFNMRWIKQNWIQTWHQNRTQTFNRNPQIQQRKQGSEDGGKIWQGSGEIPDDIIIIRNIRGTERERGTSEYSDREPFSEDTEGSRTFWKLAPSDASAFKNSGCDPSLYKCHTPPSPNSQCTSNPCHCHARIVLRGLWR